jgi:hypothetical protein
MTGVVEPDEGMGDSGSAKAKAIYHEARNCIESLRSGHQSDAFQVKATP